MDDDQDQIEGAAARVWGVVRRSAVSIGRSVAGAYRFVDPDVWRHAYQLPLAGLSLLVPRPGTVQALPPDGFRPVIFVHGLGGHPGNFVGLKTYFAGRGRTRTYVVDFGNASSLTVMADHLRNALEDVYACNDLEDDERVDLVAHSMGGLVARLVLDDEVWRNRVANLVTLGTPHLGSHLARFAASESTVELRPGSDTLSLLETQEFWGREESPLLTAFWSRADTIVLPAESARFSDGRTVEVQGVTHYAYLMYPSVFTEVWKALLT